MDLDAMWNAFVRYRPMLDEMFDQWSADQANQKLMAEARRSVDGRVLSEEEVAQNQAGATGGPAAAGFVVPGVHAVPTRRYEAGSDEELDRLREIADERGVEYDRRWRGHHLRQELGFGEDDELPQPTASRPTASTATPGQGETGSGEGSQDNPTGPGHTASGAGGQDNLAGTGHTASGAGGQDNPTPVGAQGGQDERSGGRRGDAHQDARRGRDKR